MNDNKGQALIEFIIILPIFLLLIISTIDFGNIILKKYSLENDIDIISSLYQENNIEKINNYVTTNNIKITYSEDDKYLTIKLSKNVKITSLALIPIFGKNYEINASKVIIDE